MALVVEDGSLVSGANSYVSRSDFTAWADARGITYPADTAELEQKILRAMDFIESLAFKGEKHTETQALQWPRDYVFIDGYSIEGDEIPAEVKIAVYESTKVEIDGDSKLTPSERETIREKVGDIEVQYSSSSSMKRSTPAIMKALYKLIHSPLEVSRV